MAVNPKKCKLSFHTPSFLYCYNVYLNIISQSYRPRADQKQETQNQPNGSPQTSQSLPPCVFSKVQCGHTFIPPLALPPWAAITSSNIPDGISWSIDPDDAAGAEVDGRGGAVPKSLVLVDQHTFWEIINTYEQFREWKSSMSASHLWRRGCRVPLHFLTDQGRMQRA